MQKAQKAHFRANKFNMLQCINIEIQTFYITVIVYQALKYISDSGSNVNDSAVYQAKTEKSSNINLSPFFISSELLVLNRKNIHPSARNPDYGLAISFAPISVRLLQAQLWYELTLIPSPVP